MAFYVGYQAAGPCTGGPTPGALALMSWFLGAHDSGVNLGIYNCRPIAGSTTTSLHGEGRADDLGVIPHGARWGTVLANRLRTHSGELGIQCIIWNRRIWSGSHPDDGWRRYNGDNPHIDHLHVELSWDAARTLTVADVQRAIGGRKRRGGATKPGDTATNTNRLERHPYLRLGSTGMAVRQLQSWLNRVYPAYSDLGVDGIFGAKTARVVREFQQRSNIKADGLVGPVTWAALGF
jgi:hypothetical protein